MRRARGVADEEDPPGIAAVTRGVLLRPCDCARDVLRAARILERGRKPILDIQRKAAVAREVVGDVGVDLVVHVLVAPDERAAVDEDRDRRIHRGARAVEVEDLARMVAVNEAPAHLDARLRRGGEQRTIDLHDDIPVVLNVGAPDRADLGESAAVGRRQIE